MDATVQFGISYAAITLFCLIFSLIVLFRTTHDIGSEREVSFFRLMVYSFIVFAATEFVWALGNFKVVTLPVGLLSAMSLLTMIALAFICYFWFCYGETKLGNNLLERPLVLALSATPVAVLTILYVSSPFTGLMYTYGADGTFIHGPLYDLAVPLEDIYILLVTVHALIKIKDEKSATRRRQLLSLIFFPLLPTLAGIFDTFVPAMPVIAPALFASIFFVFTDLQESQIFNDALTGLNNRRRAERYLDDIIPTASPTHPIYLFMIDVNDFKQVNDTYGHLVGDRALRIVANGIKATCVDLRAFAARWGGDEFMIVGEERFIGSPEDLVSALQANIAAQSAAEGVPYSLTVSVGYSLCTSPHDSKDQMEQTADEMLYRQKAARHTPLATA